MLFREVHSAIVNVILGDDMKPGRGLSHNSQKLSRFRSKYRLLNTANLIAGAVVFVMVLGGVYISDAVRQKPFASLESTFAQAPGQPAPLGFLDTNLFGAPLSTEDPNTPVIGNYGHYTNDQNGRVGVSFKALYTGQLESIRTLFGSQNGRDPSYCWYACGTGGIIRYSLFNADSRGYPTGAPLASDVYARNLTNGSHPQGPGIDSYQILDHPRLVFTTKAALTKGSYYVITFENIDPDPVTNKSLVNWQDWADLSNIPRQGPFMDPTSLDHRAWGTIMSNDGVNWFPASEWNSNPSEASDVIPMLGIKMTDGSSFGNAYITEDVDHVSYTHQSGLSGLKGLDVQRGADLRVEEFSTPQDFSTDRMAVTLVPYESGTVDYALRDMSNNSVVSSCKVSIEGVDQETAFYKNRVASRVYSCDIPKVTVRVGRLYHLEVSTSDTAKASIIRLYDGPGWPYLSVDGTHPYGETPNATFQGRSLNYCIIDCGGGPLDQAYDMSFYLRIADKPVATPTATPSATPRPTASPSPSVTPTASPNPSATPTPSATPRPSTTPTSTALVRVTVPSTYPRIGSKAYDLAARSVSLTVSVTGTAPNLTATVNGTLTPLSGGKLSLPNANGDYKVIIKDTSRTYFSQTVRLRHPDFNRDNTTNLTDLNLLNARIGKPYRAAYTIYDLNLDGRLDATDTAKLKAGWGK